MFRRLGEFLDAWISQNNAIQIFFQVWTLVVSIAGLVAGLLKIPNLPIIILVVLFALSASFLFLNVRIFEDKRVLKQALTFIVDAQPAQYRYTLWNQKVTVSRSGDGKYVTRYTVEALAPSVQWVRIRIGATDSAPSASLKTLGLQVRDSSGNPIRYYAVSDEPRSKELVILFSTPATPVDPYSFSIEHTWPDSWKDLISHREDFGKVSFRSDLDLFRYAIEVPSGVLKLTALHVNPPVPGSTVTINATGTEAIWEVTSFPAGRDHRYDIKASGA